MNAILDPKVRPLVVIAEETRAQARELEDHARWLAGQGRLEASLNIVRQAEDRHRSADLLLSFDRSGL